MQHLKPPPHGLSQEMPTPCLQGEPAHRLRGTSAGVLLMGAFPCLPLSPSSPPQLIFSVFTDVQDRGLGVVLDSSQPYPAANHLGESSQPFCKVLLEYNPSSALAWSSPILPALVPQYLHSSPPVCPFCNSQGSPVSTWVRAGYSSAHSPPWLLPPSE